MLSRKKKLLLIVVMSVGVVVVLELAARLYVPAEAEPVVPVAVGRFDERLGWRPKEGAHATSLRTGSAVEYRINSKGLRDDETSYTKPENTYRIVLIGDSRAYGFGVPIEQHFSRILEEHFNDVEVVNLGVGGFGIDQELLYLRYEGFRYEPDLVIAYVSHFGGNRHMHTERWGTKKPRFKLVAGDLILVNSPVVKDSLSPTPPTTLAQVNAWCAGHSRFYEVVTGGLPRLVSLLKGPEAQLELEDERELAKPDFRKELYALADAIIQAMHDESAAHGAEFVLLTQMEDVHEAATARQILSLEVGDRMRNPEFDLPDGLSHINEAGNRVLAAEIAAFLRSRGLLPARHLKPNAPTR